MKASIKAKAALAVILYSAGIISWRFRRYSKNHFVILTYHRVIPKKETGTTVQAGMVVEPETLDLHLRFLRKYFEIVPISYLASLQEFHRHEIQNNPLCAITFDDGWYDFYKYAYPLIKHHQVHVTVFLPTDFIGTNRWFWTDRLSFLLERIGNYRDLVKVISGAVNPLVNQITNMSETFEIRLEKAITLLKNYRIEKIEEVLSELTAIIEEDSTPPDRAFLSWEEVKEMTASGLVAFGSHSAGHSILTTIKGAEAQHELIKSMVTLLSHQVVEPACIPFSYPNGNFTDKLSEMVRKTGYHIAVTTKRGWNRRGDNPFQLKRIPIHQDMTASEAMFGSRIVNLL